MKCTILFLLQHSQISARECVIPERVYVHIFIIIPFMEIILTGHPPSGLCRHILYRNCIRNNLFYTLLSNEVQGNGACIVIYGMDTDEVDLI